MALEIKHIKNCFEGYLQNRKYRKKWLYLGYLEACLVQFEVIESKSNGLEDYIIIKANGRTEDREDVLVRLTQEFLNKVKENG